MKITFEVEDVVATIEDKDGVTLDDALNLFEQALLGVGFKFNGYLDVITEEPGYGADN